MKKNLVLISLLMACVLLLASCDSLATLLPAPMNARQLERRVNRKMENVQSYRTDIEMQYRTYAGGGKITGSATGVLIEDRPEDESDYYSYMELKNEIKSGNTTIKLRNTEAYLDGTAYSLFGDGKFTRKLYSEMTPEEYNVYREGESLVEFNLQDCENAEMEKTEQGYVLTYSGYSAQAVRDYSQASGMGLDLFGEDLKDLNVTMQVNKDYLPDKITMEMVFDVEEGSYYQPQASITMTFSQFNEAERITKGFSDQQYVKIESLSLLKQLERMIEDKIDAKETSFSFDISQSVTMMGQSNEERLRGHVSFTRDKDGLSYKAELTEDENMESVVEYKNGQKTTEINGKTTTVDMAEYKAEQYISSLINDSALGYNINYVTNIKRKGDGYLVAMGTSKNSVMGQSVTSTGATFGNASHTIEFVLDGDELKSMTAQYKAMGMVSVNMGWNTSVTMHILGNASVEFE